MPQRKPLWLHKQGLVNGVNWHWVEAGNPSKPLVLLLHGWGECWYTWRDTIAALTSSTAENNGRHAHDNSHFRVVAVDIKGYNLSDKPATGYDLVTLAYDIAQIILLIRPANNTETTLVGHDHGGLIAWTTAALHPESVQKLVILNAPHPTQLATLRLGWKYRFASRRCYLAQLSCSPEFFFSWNHAWWLTRHFTSSSFKKKKRIVIDPDMLTVLRDAAALPGAIAGLLRHARALPRSLAHQATVLPQVAIPTLVLAGAKDRYWPVQLWTKEDNLSEHMCYGHLLETIILPDCEHWVHHEMPDAFHQHLLSFLTTASSR